MQEQGIDQNTISQCFAHIHNPASSHSLRKQADNYLIQCETKFVPLLNSLAAIFANPQKYNPQIRLLALIYMANVAKRNWNNKRLTKSNPQFSQIKRNISVQLLPFLANPQKIFIKTLYDLVGFIVKSDYPHSYPQFTHFTLVILEQIKIQQQQVEIFKRLRDVYVELGERKGFTSFKNYQEGPRKIINALGPLTEAFRQQLCKIADVNPVVVKLSKYCDQILISLLRIAPYSYLDDEKFMLFPNHICQKLQTLLTAHNEHHNLKSTKNKDLLQKDIKSLIYLMGCFQTCNPCALSLTLSDYISTILYLISKPQLFVKPQTLKYSLLSMRKLLKQFTYNAQTSLYEKSINNSQPKSTNYIQLRKIAHEKYKEFFTSDTIQSMFKFLVTGVMGIGKDENEIGFEQQENNGQSIYQKSAQKQLPLNTATTMLIQTLIQQHPQLLLPQIHETLTSLLASSFTGIDSQTLVNFLTILSILPKCCKRAHLNYLGQFPIVKVLQFVNGATDSKVRSRFPSIVAGWVDIFSAEEIAQLGDVLVQYIIQGANSSHIDVLLYSCFSLNKIVTLRTSAIDSSQMLNRIFPIALQIFTSTQNPEVLWPLLSLISTLLTKSPVDTSHLLSSLKQSSLNSLINSQSNLLGEALCEMLKSFLCLVPRNAPAYGIFAAVWKFLNIHLGRQGTSYYDKTIQLWYYAIRQYGTGAGDLGKQYWQLFQTYYRKCMLNKKLPILIYILQQYMLLGLIQSKLDKFVQTVIQYYRQAQFLETAQFLQPQNNSALSLASSVSTRQQSTNLKIAALSFQITLITKYNIQQANSEQMLYAIVKDFCQAGSNGNQTTQEFSVKNLSNTLRNSLLSIINRYLIKYPDYFFNFLREKMDITPNAFYEYYFKNMEHLTSRTAIKINTIALITLLPSLPQQFGTNAEQMWFYLIASLKTILQQISTGSSSSTPILSSNVGQVQNSPIYRFSQSILSQRKEQIRKESGYEGVNLKQLFRDKFPLCLQALGPGVGLQGVAMRIENIWPGGGNKLMEICN